MLANYTGAALLSASLTLTACGGGAGSGTSAILASGYPAAPVSCDTTAQRNWLRDYMFDQYFWYDRQGTPNASATTMSGYLDSLLYTTLDRYSYAQSTAQFAQFFAEGRRTGYGYSLAWADAASTILKVRLVEPLSPVGLAGLLRGDTIVSIDGFNAEQIAGGALASVSTEGVARVFVVANALGIQRSLNVNSADYPLTPVINASVMTASNGAKVGYLAYQEFISTSATALGNAVNSFRAAGVSEVILDLRYNGGGSSSVARNLASMLGGVALNGQVFASYRFNAKLSASDFSQTFTSSTATLPAAPLAGINRLLVISSGSTASASEMVINGLRPYMSVITVGSTSYGKPYAFIPRDACETTYSAVNLQIVNANNFGDYASGIAATCPMSDDLTRQLGDKNELRTAAALSYISNGFCPPIASVLEEKKAFTLMDNAPTAPKFIADGVALGEDGKPLARPRGVQISP